MSGEREQERQAHQDQLRISAAAAAALQNEAVMAYFDEVETRAIDAMLAADPTEDLARFRLSVVAVTIRHLKAFLREARPAGEFAAAMLERIRKEESSR